MKAIASLPLSETDTGCVSIILIERHGVIEAFNEVLSSSLESVHIKQSVITEKAIVIVIKAIVIM